jgi:hypothetical protein
MDEDWAAGVLGWWIDNAPKARSTTAGGGHYSYGRTGTSAMNALREREDETRRVVAKIQGASQLPDLLPPTTQIGVVEINVGVDLCRSVLGILTRGAETRAKLGSEAPTMVADGLHPTVWNAASGRWNSGHYSDAVQRAATYLAADIRDRLGRHDVNDSELMREAFSLSPAAHGKVRLRWPGADGDQTVKSMRVGILSYSQGVYSAIRNPATHSTDDLERQEALEQLAALSMLARWVEKCEVVTV